MDKYYFLQTELTKPGKGIPLRLRDDRLEDLAEFLNLRHMWDNSTFGFFYGNLNIGYRGAKRIEFPEDPIIFQLTYDGKLSLLYNGAHKPKINEISEKEAEKISAEIEGWQGMQALVEY